MSTRHETPVASPGDVMRAHILLLAAGGSSRMGQSKQLLKLEGEPLLVRTAKTALASAVPVTVVLGAHANAHRTILAGLPVQIVENPDWEKGMGRSLKCGLTSVLTTDPHLDAVLVMLCDQPKVTSAYLERMMRAAVASEKQIIASAYSETLGVPALFKATMFPMLQQLGDQAGAGALIRAHAGDTEPLDFPDGALDLDTPADVGQFLGLPDGSV